MLTVKKWENSNASKITFHYKLKWLFNSCYVKHCVNFLHNRSETSDCDIEIYCTADELNMSTTSPRVTFPLHSQKKNIFKSKKSRKVTPQEKNEEKYSLE